MKNSKKVFILTEAVLGILVLMLAVVMLLDKSGKDPYRVSVIIENSEAVSYTHLTLPTILRV